jgi:undecaprenyl pyrophosphate phosphatase UppP
MAAAFAAGVGASFASTLASVRVLRAVERGRPFLPWALYRVALAVVVLRRCENPPR